MSTEENPPISWLELAPADETPEILAALERTRARLGYVRNGQAALLHRPGLVLAIEQLSLAATQNPDSGLSRTERELIALVVSIENKCQPCIFTHAAALRGITGDPLWVAKVEANFRHAGLSERERALVDYALLITLDPASIEASDLDLLRDAGIPDADILDAAAVVAYFNFSNRINSALGVVPNTEAFLAHR
jgi:uncharacterized peroxidase-related enzyme